MNLAQYNALLDIVKANKNNPERAMEAIIKLLANSAPAS